MRETCWCQTPYFFLKLVSAVGLLVVVQLGGCFRRHLMHALELFMYLCLDTGLIQCWEVSEHAHWLCSFLPPRLQLCGFVVVFFFLMLAFRDSFQAFCIAHRGWEQPGSWQKAASALRGLWWADPELLKSVGICIALKKSRKFSESSPTSSGASPLLTYLNLVVLPLIFPSSMAR